MNALLRLDGVRCRVGDQWLFDDGLSAVLNPGLVVVRGGEGRGKTSLLRVMAGRLQPETGSVLRSNGLTVVWNDPQDAQDEQLSARAWLDVQSGCHVHWNAAAARASIEALRLQEHLDKALFMLSTGTRRKLALVVAWASQADLVLLDNPLAALDARSREALVGRLNQQIAPISNEQNGQTAIGEHGRPEAESARASAALRSVWVVADYEQPEGLMSDVPGARFGVIDLGD